MDDSSSYYLQTLVFPFLLALPMLLVILGGMVFSVIKYKKAPKASILSFAGLGLFLLVRLVYFIQPMLNIWLLQGSIDQTTFSYVIAGVSVVTAIIGAIALALLVFAIWSQRD